MKNRQNEDNFFKRHEIIIKAVLYFLVCQIVFVPLFTFLLTYYGPFNNVRDTLVTTAMQTMNHKYIATWFLSQKTIDDIVSRTRLGAQTEDTNLEDIVISEKNLDGIEVLDISKGSYKGKLLVINDPSRVKLGSAVKLGKAGSTLSEIVENEKAVAGVNAGGFNDDGKGTGGDLVGVIIKDGELLFEESDTAYGTYSSIIGFNHENKLVIKSNVSKSQLKEMNLRCAVSFGPALIVNGKGRISSSKVGDGIQPRTAIGQTKDGAILLLVVDGRGAGGSIGVTYYDLQNILLEHGAYNAANLDGGSSTTMVYGGKVINTPSDIMGERAIPTAFVVTGKAK